MAEARHDPREIKPVPPSMEDARKKAVEVLQMLGRWLRDEYGYGGVWFEYEPALWIDDVLKEAGGMVQDVLALMKEADDEQAEDGSGDGAGEGGRGSDGGVGEGGRGGAGAGEGSVGGRVSGGSREDLVGGRGGVPAGADAAGGSEAAAEQAEGEGRTMMEVAEKVVYEKRLHDLKVLRDMLEEVQKQIAAIPCAAGGKQDFVDGVLYGCDMTVQTMVDQLEEAVLWARECGGGVTDDL